MKKILSFTLMVAIVFSCFLVPNVSQAASMRGDANLDGYINAADVLDISKYIADVDNTVFDLKKADANNDGEINTLDTLEIISYLVKKKLTLHIDRDPGWNTLVDWEDGTDGVKPTNVTRVKGALTCEELTADLIKDNKNELSTKALRYYTTGVYSTDQTTQGINPTCGGTYNNFINLRNYSSKLSYATNLRVLMRMNNPTGFVKGYIGLKINNRDIYYYPITNENYANFNYFYFVGKEFVKFTTNYRRTFLEDEQVETRVISKSDIPKITHIYLWLESNTSSNQWYIDDIDCFEGEDGFDSTEHDARLPQPQDPVADGKTRYLAVSFDDGPQKYSDGNKYYMDYYMDVAKSKDFEAKMTFFLVGQNCKQEVVPTLERALEEGHELQNHSWTHPNLTSLSGATTEDKKAVIAKQINDVDNWLLANVKGAKKTTVLRPPFLAMSGTAYDALRESTNIKACVGGPCPTDYNLTSVDYRIWYYKENLVDGSIILAHEHYIDNVYVINWMFDYYHNLGYEFVGVEEMFEIKKVTPTLDTIYGEVY